MVLSESLDKAQIESKSDLNTFAIVPEVIKLLSILLLDVFFIIILLGNFIGFSNDYFANSGQNISNYYIYLITGNMVAILVIYLIYLVLKYSLDQKYSLGNFFKITAYTILSIWFLVYFFISFLSIINPYMDVNFGSLNFYQTPVTNINSFIGPVSFILFVIIGVLGFYLLNNWKSSENKTKEIFTRSSIFNYFKSSFLYYYIINFLLLVSIYYIARDSYKIDQMFVIVVTINFFFPLLILESDKFKNKDFNYSLTKFGVNLLIIFLFLVSYFVLYSAKSSSIYYFEKHYFSSVSGYYLEKISAYMVFYSSIGFFWILYHYRKNISVMVSNYIRKPFSFLLYFLTVRKLNNNDQAVFFARRFIVIQSDVIRSRLPGMAPNTVNNNFKEIFNNDIDRMYRLLTVNKIKTYSNKGVLQFVMSIAKPIIVDMQRTLQEHITLELLKKDNNSKNLQVDVDDLWNKVNKIMTQWESTFTDSEMAWKDSLLMK